MPDPALLEGRTSDDPHGFELQTAEARDGGSVWLRHMVTNNQNE